MSTYRPLAVRVRFVAPTLFFLAVLVMLGASAAETSFAQTAPSQEVLPASSYYIVTGIDPRLCPSPVCGGVYVKLVNRKRTPCADGSVTHQCYAPLLDWSALGLTEEEVFELEAGFRNQRVLARGSLGLVASPYGPLPQLKVTDAWVGVTGKAVTQAFHGLSSSGIVCITHPCPILNHVKLNRRIERLVHGVDLAASGASSAQIEAGQQALFQGDGLLATGVFQTISGPAGRGLSLTVEEFYLRVESRQDGS